MATFHLLRSLRDVLAMYIQLLTEVLIYTVLKECVQNAWGPYRKNQKVVTYFSLHAPVLIWYGHCLYGGLP